MIASFRIVVAVLLTLQYPRFSHSASAGRPWSRRNVCPGRRGPCISSSVEGATGWHNGRV
jgi:hypothetical protein